MDTTISNMHARVTTGTAHTFGGGFNLSLKTNGMPSREENREPTKNVTI